MSTFVKLVGREHAVESAFFRFLFGLATVGVIWAVRRVRLRPVNWRWLIARGAMGSASVYCLYRSIGHLGLAQGSILFFAYPIFTALFALAVLGERQTFGGWMAILLAFLGVYLIVWPKDWSGAVAHKAVAVLGALLAGIAVGTVRELRKTDSSYTIFSSLCVFGILVVAVRSTTDGFCLSFRPTAWACIFGVGFFGTLGQLMMTFAYKYVRASSGSIYSFVTPVLNVLMGALLFAESLSLRGWLGACLVLGACVYVSLPRPTVEQGGDFPQSRSAS